MFHHRFVALGAMVLLIAACSDPVPVTDPIVRPVRYQRVDLQLGEERRTFSGTARASLETDLSFKVQGTLIDLPIDVGDKVKRGQRIASIDAADYQVRKQEAEAGLAQAQAELRNSEASYDRTRGLYENRSASRSELDAARAGAESARARVNAANQQREAARLQLSYTRLTAPQDCTVAAVFMKENENVAAGQSIAQLNCGDCSEISVAVPETFIGRVSAGSEVEVEVDALPDEKIAGVVTEVGVAAVGATYPVIVVVTGECPEIRSGMAADVRFRLPVETGPRQIVVPPVSVGEDRVGNYVFVLEADEQGKWHARRRSVEVTGILSEGLLISSGLSEGELIATAGVRRITDGLEVRLLDQSGS